MAPSSPDAPDGPVRLGAVSLTPSTGAPPPPTGSLRPLLRLSRTAMPRRAGGGDDDRDRGAASEGFGPRQGATVAPDGLPDADQVAAVERQLRHLLAIAPDPVPRPLEPRPSGGAERFPRLGPTGRLQGGHAVTPGPRPRPRQLVVTPVTAPVRTGAGDPPTGRRGRAGDAGTPAPASGPSLGQVTKVAAVPDQPGRWTIWIDGTRWGRVDDATLLTHQLLTSPVLSIEAQDTIATQCVRLLLRDRALGSLSRNEQSTARLAQKLRRPLPPQCGGGRVDGATVHELVTETLAWVGAQGWIDEGRQALERTRTWAAQGMPARAIARRLRARGVEADAITAAWRTVLDERTEAEAARDPADGAAEDPTLAAAWGFVTGRRRQLERRAPRDARQTLRRWLVGRGFDGDVVRTVLARWDADRRDAP